MSDDLVKRLRDPFYTPSLKSHAEAADRIEELEKYQSLHSQCDKSSLEIEKKLVQRLGSAHTRIEKLERALEKIAVHHRYNEEMASIARKALEE